MRPRISEKTRFTVYASAPLLRRLRSICAEEGRVLCEWFREQAEKYVAEHNPIEVPTDQNTFQSQSLPKIKDNLFFSKPLNEVIRGNTTEFATEGIQCSGDEEVSQCPDNVGRRTIRFKSGKRVF